MINRSYTSTISAVAGTVSETIYGNHSAINQIRVKATTGTNVFDVKLTDRNSIVIFEQKDIYAELAEITDLVIDGSFTLTISNSDVDEAFTTLFVFKEL